MRDLIETTEIIRRLFEVGKPVVERNVPEDL